MLDEIVERNASKFAIFLEKENPNTYLVIFFVLHFEQLFTTRIGVGILGSRALPKKYVLPFVLQKKQDFLKCKYILTCFYVYLLISNNYKYFFCTTYSV